MSATRRSRSPWPGSGPGAPGWTPHSLRPESVEFRQGDKERRHTRLAHLRDGSGWTKRLLWP
ncbi:pyridoxine 5'-phosphate oxidase C-terminal domain-containing protein [Streptomyces sp. NPDC050535]|uniref:pyridoxine 5'-phosphate oxidase C-terminal domain-containing protein n=1 Tax=Streptomyces sp. NPDC050535 TaxID=3365626 RepID=UPI0037A1D08A